MYALRLDFTIPVEDPIHLALKLSRIMFSPTVKLTPFFFQSDHGSTKLLPWSDQGFCNQTKDPGINSPKL